MRNGTGTVYRIEVCGELGAVRHFLYLSGALLSAAVTRGVKDHRTVQRLMRKLRVQIR
jgi:hypothetical protein